MIKKIHIQQIACFTLLSGSVWAQTGIGTTAPVNKLEVVTTTADPASSGSAANGNLRLGGISAVHVLDFGLSSTSTFSWIQARNKTYGTNYILGINPLGGYVGIGTSAPTATLTVGNAGGTIPGEITLNPTTNAYEGGQINFKKSLTGSTADWSIDQYGTTAADARLRIFNTSETNGMIIKENGYIGMGNSTPTVRLQVTGDIIANSIAGSSDARFKTNITPIANPLQKVLALRGVHFNWNTSAFPQRMFSDKRTLGFIAQEVEKVLPEIVQTENTTEGYKSVQYDKVVALLVEAMKEQQKQINQLKRELIKLKRRAH
jgi:Chaperone of endosialidase